MACRNYCVAIRFQEITGSKSRLIGTKSNRSGIGARVELHCDFPGESKPHRQIDEVRSGGGYFSQSDLRIHFGLAKRRK